MPPNQVAGETMLAVVALLAAWYVVSERQRFKGVVLEAAAESEP
jgi:hypothetical protein